ncbi:putative cytokinetic ring protein SteA [soil metagenome]
MAAVMKLSPLRRSRAVQSPGLSGVARIDRRSAVLAGRLHPGEIAVIHHLDLDRATAEALVSARVAAVVNAAPSVSGRYPNLGPRVIAAAGIPLVDVLDGDVFAVLRDGDQVRIDGGQLFRGSRLLADGELLDQARFEQRLADARSGLSAQLEAFTFNTVEYLRRDEHLLIDGGGLPDLRVSLAGRQVLVVARSYDYRADLRGLRSYIRQNRPVLVGVDAGADALTEAGHTPDLVVGDLGTVSDKTIRSATELVVQGVVVDRERLDRLGVRAVAYPASGTSEDAAILLADSCGASLIVTAGSHAGLEEFLDRGQSGMASSFLTRLRAGPKLVDAKAVARLQHNRVSSWLLVLLLLAGLLAVLLAVAITPAGEQWLGAIATGWSDLLAVVREPFT